MFPASEAEPAEHLFPNSATALPWGNATPLAAIFYVSAVAAATALARVIYLQLRTAAEPHAAPNGGPASIDPLDLIKTTITVACGVPEVGLGR